MVLGNFGVAVDLGFGVFRELVLENVATSVSVLDKADALGENDSSERFDCCHI